MIPKVNSNLLTLEAETRPTSRTWKLNTGAGTIAGTADEKDAMMQAIYLILSTERYQYLIYGWDYGIETGDLIGRPPDYVQSELKRRIREALMWDDRVTAVDGDVYKRQVPNDAAGRVSLWNDIVRHHQQLQTLRAIQTFEPENVTVEAGDTKKAVVVTDRVTPVNAMEQLYMVCVVA